MDGSNGWMTVVEVAKSLRMSRETIYRMIHEDVLPALRYGRTIRVHADDLRKLTDRRTESRSRRASHDSH